MSNEHSELEAAGAVATPATKDPCAVPEAVDRELVRCAAQNGRISLGYLRGLWRRGFEAGHNEGYLAGLDESAGDPRVECLELGFKAIQDATGGEWSHEDRIVLDALQAGREFAVALARRDGVVASLREMVALYDRTDDMLQPSTGVLEKVQRARAALVRAGGR